MKNRFLLPGMMLVLAACGRYSQVAKEPNKEIKMQNPRVYGEVGGPARQSKQTYPTPADAADKSARIREVMFGNKKTAAQIAAEEVTAPVQAAAAPVDSASEKK